MNECKDCIRVKNLEDKIETLCKNFDDKNKAIWHQVNESKAERKDFEKRIKELEIISNVTEERLDGIFKSIEAIEKNIEKIATSMEQLQIKPAKTYENLKYEVVKYVVIAAIAFVVAKFIK